MIPEVLEGVGRQRAAAMVEDADPSGQLDLETSTAIAARKALARQVLAAFSTEEIRSELSCRDLEQGTELGK